MKKFSALIAILLFTHILPKAQSAFIEWSKCYGSYTGDYAYNIQLTSDGGYIAIGQVESAGGDVKGYHGNTAVNDAWVIKLNSAGIMQWQKCLGGIFFDIGSDILQDKDGGYMVLGTSASVNCDVPDNHGGTDVWLTKLSPSGDIEWQKRLGGSMNEYAQSIDAAPGGGYFICGYSQSSDKDLTKNNGDYDYWVLKVDAAGNLIWQNSGGGSGVEEGLSIKATPDGGAVATGTTWSANGDFASSYGSEDAWVAKFDKNGALQWRKNYGSSGFDGGNSIQCTNDGGYIMAGFSGANDHDVSGNHGASDYWLVKLNSDGSIAWQKCYGGFKNETANNVQLTVDGGYILCGDAESNDGDLSCNAGNDDMWVVKVDGSGDIEWGKSMGGEGQDQAFCVKPVNAKEYIVAGFACSKNVSGYHVTTSSNYTCTDFWIVKLSAPLAVPPKPQVLIDPSSASICAGGDATISAAVLNAGENPSYIWTKNGAFVGSNLSYTANDLKNNDVIVCTVSSGGACEGPAQQASNSVTIKTKNNNIKPVATITADNTIICGCTRVTIKAAIAGAGNLPVYGWLLNGLITDVDKNVYTSGTLNAGDAVQFIYKDTSGCIAGDSVLSNAIVFSSGTIVNPQVSITASTTNICIGSTIKFTAVAANAGSAPTYHWKINGANAGSNADTLTTASLKDGDVVSCLLNADPAYACAAQGSATSNNIIIKVTGSVMPVVQISTPSTAGCTGAPVTFTATATNAGAAPTYSWQVNNNVIAGANKSTFTTTLLQDGDIVNCSVKIDPAFTCALKDTAVSNTITLSLKTGVAPLISIAASPNPVCAGNQVVFTATPSNAGNAPSYRWQLNNSLVGSNAPLYSVSTLTPKDSVMCVLTPSADACGQAPVSSNKLNVVINDTPAIHITPFDTLVNAGSAVQLNVTAPGNIMSHTWQPAGMLLNATLLSPKTIALNNDVQFVLAVTDINGCSAQTTAVIKIFSPFLMPTAFTPNGDNKNDVFSIPLHAQIKLRDFFIYNRWGQVIFSTQDVGKGWDGNVNGLPAPTGVYVYMITANDNNGKSLFVKGTVVLIR